MAAVSIPATVIDRMVNIYRGQGAQNALRLTESITPRRGAS